MKRLGRRLSEWGIGVAGVLMAGCGSPPSVTPLLAVTQRALVQESQHLAEDMQRDAQWAQQTRTALAQAYEADLQSRQTLSPQWVREATDVYVLAREEILRHELALLRQRQERIDNLVAAGEATQRAAAMLQKQDELLRSLLGGDGWDLVQMVQPAK